MTVRLPADLQRKSEEVHRYLLPNGDWKPDTPDFIKEYKKEIYAFIISVAKEQYD